MTTGKCKASWIYGLIFTISLLFGINTDAQAWQRWYGGGWHEGWRHGHGWYGPGYHNGWRTVYYGPHCYRTWVSTVDGPIRMKVCN